MDPQTVIDLLNGNAFQHIAGACHVTIFSVTRTTKHGPPQVVRVEIHDAGTNVPAGQRYSCYTTADNGKEAMGNPMPTIHAALAAVHWWDMD